MTGRDVVSIIRHKVGEAENQGAVSVPLANIRILLDQIERDVDETNPAAGRFNAIFSAKTQTALAHYRARVDFVLELLRATINTGQAALKALFLVNGGAAVALLAFVGHLATSDTGHASDFALPLLMFVIGLTCVTTASGFTYLGQRTISQKGKPRRWLRLYDRVIISLGILSLISFAVGCYLAYLAFSAIDSATNGRLT